MATASIPGSNQGTPAVSPSPGTELSPLPTLRCADDPILCSHCGRTARNGITCQGVCVADSGY